MPVEVDEVVDEEVPVAPGDPDGDWVSPEEPAAFVDSVHDLTSWTADLPLASVIGVRMMVHVRIIGPITVWVVCVVISVVGEPKLSA